MQSYSKLDKNPNIILKYHRVNITKWAEDSSKLSNLHYSKTWYSSPKWCPNAPLFVLLWKGEDLALREEMVVINCSKEQCW